MVSPNRLKGNYCKHSPSGAGPSISEMLVIPMSFITVFSSDTAIYCNWLIPTVYTTSHLLLFRILMNVCSASRGLLATRKINYPASVSTFYLLFLQLMRILVRVFVMRSGKVQSWLIVYQEWALQGAGWYTATWEARQIKEPWQWKADVTVADVADVAAKQLYSHVKTVRDNIVNPD